VRGLHRALIGLAIAGALTVSGAATSDALPLRETGGTVSVAAASPLPAAAFGLHPGLPDSTPPATGMAGSVRLWDTGTQWADLQPAAGPINLAPLDAAVAAAQSRGTTDVLLVLGMTPSWASSDPTRIGYYGRGISTAPPKEDGGDALWRAYVSAVARHAKDQHPGIRWSFQVWNEANLPSFYSGTPERLAALTALADREVKAVSPAFRVVAPSTTTRMGIPAGSFFRRYLTALATASGFGGRPWPVDVFAAHTYPSGTGTPVDAAAGIALMRRVLAAAGAPSRPLWITEINYGIAGPRTVPGRSIPGAEGAEYLARTYLDAIRLNVGRAYWYRWQPQGTYLGVTTHTATPATTAMVRLRSWLAGWTVSSCARTASGVRTCRFTRTVSGVVRTRTMAWTDGAPARLVRTGTASVCPVYGPCVSRTGSFTVTGLPVRIG